MATLPAPRTYGAPAGAATARFGNGAPAAPAMTGAYRTTQPLLLADVGPSTELAVITDGNGTLPRTPPRASVADPKGGFIWGRYGPSWLHWDKYAQAAWTTPGGDWVNTVGVAQALTSPHFSFAANSATTGTLAYTVPFTVALQAVQTSGRHCIFIAHVVGGNRAFCAQTHADPAMRPRIFVRYSDGSTGTLMGRACVRLEPSSNYTRVGWTEAGITPAVLEFDRPKGPVAFAELRIGVAQHTTTATTINGYLCTPPIATSAPVVTGVADAYPRDAGIAAAPGVILSHRYQDGSVLSDWVLLDPLSNVMAKAQWDPDVLGTGAADTTKLPTASNGTALNGRWLHTLPAHAANVTLVNSSYTSEGFEPLAPGLGALRVVTRGMGTDADGTAYPGFGAYGCTMMAMFPKGVCGSETVRETYTRQYIRLGMPSRKALAQMRMVRQTGGPAEYAYDHFKWGVGVHHVTNEGGNGTNGGGGLGWSNRLGGELLPGDMPMAALTPYMHTLDNQVPDQKWGAGNGMGAAIYFGRWYCIEVRTRLNTFNPAGGSPSDGVTDVYLDGQLIASFPGWKFRDGPLNVPSNATQRAPFGTLAPLGLWLNDFQGGSLLADEDLVIFYGADACGTQYIGPMNMTAPVALNISGSTWTPNRELSGNVTETDLQALPVNQPLYIAGSTLASVMEKPLRFGSQGADSETGMLNAWSGGCFVPSLNSIAMKGGGHRSSAAHDNPIVGFSLSKMAPWIIKARTTDANLQDWNPATGALQAGFDGGSSQSAPCLDGAPTATHTFNGLEHIPGNLYGNNLGAIFVPGNAMSFLNLDTNQYSITYWQPPPDGARSWSKMVNVVVGGELLSVKETPTQLERINYNATTVTAWSTIKGQGPSKGAFDRLWAGVATFSRYDYSVIIKLPALGQLVSFCATAGYGNKRMRIGDAQAANLANSGDMTPYIDTITLTSADGSHADILDAARQTDFGGSAGFVVGVTADMHSPGVWHDTARNCVWIWGNQIGGMVYKLTGIGTTNWVSQKIAGTGSLQTLVGVPTDDGHGSFGRMALWESGTAYGLVRIDGARKLAQIVRLG